ncbi:MAG: hypothetical protein U9R50_03920 [Campylobacterota bacterium]|nr:hypothetical protein [Campylobacterota bacterium]
MKKTLMYLAIIFSMSACSPHGLEVDGVSSSTKVKPEIIVHDDLVGTTTPQGVNALIDFEN